MRNTFIQTLYELAEKDSRIWLLTGDLGYSVLERFAERFPDRFINVGVAEQNMTGVAAGLALCGKIVFTYSIANFSTLRCLEQIRNDVCYHNLNVKIVAVGGGLAYGSLGYSHHGIEDIAVMRTLPNMTVIAPGDPIETELATRAIVDWPGPCYLRLGRGKEPRIHKTLPDFNVSEAIFVRQGLDVALLSTGGILKTAVELADELCKVGIKAAVVSVPTVKPFPEEFILELARRFSILVSFEEHVATGGFSEAVAAVLGRKMDSRVKLLEVNLGHPPPFYCSLAGFRKHQGIDNDALVKKILSLASAIETPLVTA